MLRIFVLADTHNKLPQQVIDLAREALARQPALCVIFATGDPRAPAKAGFGAAAVQVKPFSPEDLETAVANALNGERSGAG